MMLEFEAFFRIAWVEIREDPGTAEATMEGLAFPSRPSRAAGPEEAGRRSMSELPGIPTLFRSREASSEPPRRTARKRREKPESGARPISDLLSLLFEST
jgi:hypothetical protein